MKKTRLPEDRARKALFLAVSFLVIAFIVISIRYGNTSFSDSYPSLIVSQSLIQNHTARLDAYSERLIKHGSLYVAHGHIYPLHSLGSSVIALPAVAVAVGLGQDMTDLRSLNTMHIILTSLVLAGVFCLIFILLLNFMPFLPAAVVSVVFFFGGAYTSTMAHEMTSHGYLALLTLVAMHILVKNEDKELSDAAASLLGLVLFMSYLTRPIASVFILAVFGYLMFKNRRALLISAAVSLAGLVAFVLYSYHDFGQALPAYYIPFTHNLGQEVPFEASVPKALYGLMLSP